MIMVAPLCSNQVTCSCTSVNCSTYDAKLIDETGVSCEVDDLDLCLNDAVWVIRNDTCTAFSAAAKARAEAKAAAQAKAQ